MRKWWSLHLYALVGTLIGILLLIIGLSSRFASILIIVDILNTPAKSFVQFWHYYLNMPPYGDAGFILIPIAIILQWTLLGLLFGVLKRFHKNKNKRLGSSI